MAQHTLKSAEILLSLNALLRRFPEALEYVLAHPGEITINVPDDGTTRLKFQAGACPPDRIPLPPEGADRANAAILLGILKLVGQGGATVPTGKTKPDSGKRK
jgi:hypothetical protein